MAKFRKSYPTPQVQTYRRSVYEANCAKIQAENMMPGRRFKVAITKFSDLTDKEFETLYLNA